MIHSNQSIIAQYNQANDTQSYEMTDQIRTWFANQVVQKGLFPQFNDIGVMLTPSGINHGHIDQLY